MRYLMLIIFAAAMTFSFSARAQTETELRADSLQRALERPKNAADKAKTYCLLCKELRRAGQTDAALEQGKAGLKLARTTGAGRIEADCLLHIGGVYWETGASDSALAYLEAALRRSEEMQYRRGMAGALAGLGHIDSKAGRQTKALARFQRSVRLFEREAREELAGAKAGIGKVYYEQGDKVRALQFFQESYELRLEAGNRTVAAHMLNNMGTIYNALGEKEAAADHYRRALEIYREYGNKRGVCLVLSNMANTKLSPNDFGEALQLLAEVKKTATEAGLPDMIAQALNTYGFIYENQNKPEKALAAFLEALEIYRKKKELASMSLAYFNIAETYGNLKQPRAARAYADSALAFGRQSGNLLRLSLGFMTLSRAEAALGDWKSAYENYVLYKQYSDSLKNDAQSSEIGRIKAKVAFDKEIEARERREARATERRQMLYWITAGVFAGLLLAAGLLTWGYRAKQKANKQLAAQNAEIIQQSEEISQQRDELQALNDQLADQKAAVEKVKDEIAEQHDKLEKAHHEITDSIDYASRIQHALLPAEMTLQQGAEAYVYYKPRDVVSGDFYWTHRIDEDTALYSAADCTGHGVPGAFMSVLGATTLDTVVREYGETRPDKMLKLLDQSIRTSLKQDESKDGSLDGMDLALIKLDKKNRKLYFSSAGRPLFLLRKGEINEYKGAKFPAGGAQHGEKEFPLIEIDLEPGDRIFMCSDGITDQFGGPRGRKFSPRRLKETLLAHQDKDLQTQGAAFAEVFDEWQKSAKQLDDQLLIGLGV